MGEATRWVAINASTAAVLDAVLAARHEAGALAPDLDDVTISVQPDGDAGWKIHAIYAPGLTS